MVGRPKSRARKLAVEAVIKASDDPQLVEARQVLGLDAYIPKMPDRAKIGRPSTFDPAFSEIVLDDAIAGHSLTATAALLGVNPDTLQDWGRQFPTFGLVLARARSLRQRIFEGSLIDLVRRGGDSTRFAAVKFALINAGSDDWRDKTDAAVSVQFSLAGLVTESLKLVGSRTIEQLEQDEKPKGPENGE
jgi:hypothetical protein